MRKIAITVKADKQFIQFPAKIQEQLHKILLRLENEERNLDIEKVKGKENLYRLRKGDYRIFYEIDKFDNTFVILKIEIKGKAYRF